MKQKVFIIEDEVMARNMLARTLKENFPDLEIVGAEGSITGAVKWLSDPVNHADIIFMDVELSDGNCFEIFRQVEITSHVIMTTAYDNYAVKAFEVNSVDYLLKPITVSELKRAVDRCVSQEKSFDMEAIMSALSPKEQPQYKERYLVQLGDMIVPVKASDIAFFFSEFKDNHVVTKDGTVYIIDSTLDAITSELDPKVFFRINRGCVVAKEFVGSVTKLFGGKLQVSLEGAGGPEARWRKGYDTDLTVSRSRVEEFLKWLES
ncbi:MAG: response regulator transcription factor [Bacteroidales bacterium]|nr:response regulator transcription factor [Bacteroidales bacterium]